MTRSIGGPIRPELLIVTPSPARATVTSSLPRRSPRTKMMNVDDDTGAAPCWAACTVSERPASRRPTPPANERRRERRPTIPDCIKYSESMTSQHSTTSYEIASGRAALIDRSHLGRMVVSGRDRASYLNGLLTNDIAALKPGDGCYAAYL